MNLKDSFRYQNFLDRMFVIAQGYLGTLSNITVKTQNHLRKKANPEAEDEVAPVECERPFTCTVDDLISVLIALYGEKELLCTGISIAKAECGSDIDAMVAVNKLRQSVASTLSGMGRIKPSQRTIRGSAYKFNAEGNQVSYVYDIKEETNPDFDRDSAKKTATLMLSKADEVSSAIDKLMVDVDVDINPKFDVNGAFDDVIARIITVTK